MSRSRSIPTFAILLCALLACSPRAGHAGLTDALKKKVAEKVGKALPTPPDKPGATDKAEASGNDAGSGAAPAGQGGGDGKVSAVSTKFDFVPGDSVLFIDDFRQDELGEFPAHWRLGSGTFEIAEMKGERWLRCTSTDGHVRMKVAAGFPEFWTFEFDFYCSDPGGAIALGVSGHARDDATVWETMFPYSGSNFGFRCGSIFSDTPVTGTSIPGRHHVMFMGRGAALKAYIDRERMVNAPDVTGPGTPVELDVRLGAESHPMIANVRFAEGCRPAKDMLATGHLVTYGIRFDTGSDVVLPESAPVLRQVAAWMETNTAARLRIIGHTDNVGTAASNLDLSKRRAGAVAGVLTQQFGIAAERFQTDGKGDTKPLSNNAKPEGRAMNRRVEFATF